MMSLRELTAWHEAGHAAAMRQVGALNGAVELHGHGSGVTYHRKGLLHNMFVGDMRTRGDFLMVAIAGSLTESWQCRTSVTDLLEAQTFGNGRGDGDRVASMLNGDPLSHWVRKTERLIRSERREIEALAEVLHDRGRVDGDDARAILSGRW